MKNYQRASQNARALMRIIIVIECHSISDHVCFRFSLYLRFIAFCEAHGDKIILIITLTRATPGTTATHHHHHHLVVVSQQVKQNFSS